MRNSSAIQLAGHFRMRGPAFGEKPRARANGCCPLPRAIAPSDSKSMPLRAPHTITRAASLIIVDRSNARSIGLALSRLHEALAETDMTNVDVVRLALHLLTRGQPNACARMACDLASQADDMGEHNAYHNAQHLREVAVNMLNLCVLNIMRHSRPSLDEKDLTIAIALAVAHDLGHDGSTNSIPRLVPLHGMPLQSDRVEMVYVPFLLEDKAIAAIDSAGRRSGVAESDLRQMRAAVLATDERAGYQVLAGVLGPSISPAAKTGLFALRPELSDLANNPTALRLATMLRDADLMASCGTCAAETDRQTARLERERGLSEGSLRGEATEYFFATIARGRFLSPEAQIFQPNFGYLRALNRLRLQTADPTAVTLADIEARTPMAVRSSGFATKVANSSHRARSSRLIKSPVAALH
jgi:hypothetical protein